MSNPRSEYFKMIESRINDTDVTELLRWTNDVNRKDAIVSFTEGPARQLAYAIENALKLEATTCRVFPPMKMRKKEQCPRCGYTQMIKETSA